MTGRTAMEAALHVDRFVTQLANKGIADMRGMGAQPSREQEGALVEFASAVCIDLIMALKNHLNDEGRAVFAALLIRAADEALSPVKDDD